MNSEFFIRLIRMALVLIVQVLILNHVHFMGYATPLLIGYMVLRFHANTSRVAALLWGFVTGLCFDIFSNTAGMASSACTLMAFIQPSVLAMFAPRDAAEDFVPTIKALGVWTYLAYVIVLMFVLHFMFYILDSFSLADVRLTAFAVLGGTALSTLIAVVAELLVNTRND